MFFTKNTGQIYAKKGCQNSIIAISKTAVALAVFNIDAAAWPGQILYA